jgi:HEAT repeat protein
MITIYCPRCYTRATERDAVCAACGASLTGSDAGDYTERLIWALRHPEPTVAPRAAWVLGERQDRRAVPALIEMVRTTRDLGALEEGATALGRMGDAAAIEPLGELLRHSYVSVRARAARALACIGGPAARAVLEAARSDPSPSVRQAVEESIARLEARA